MTRRAPPTVVLLLVALAGGVVAATGGATAHPTAVAGTAETTADATVQEAPNRTLSTREIEPGGDLTVTITGDVTDSGGIVFTEQFSPAVGSASLNRVTVAGTAVDPPLARAETTGLIVTLSSSNVSVGDRVRVEYTLSVPANASAGTTFDIDGIVVSNGTVDLATDRVNVTSGATHPSGVRQAKFAAVAGPDGRLGRGEMVSVVKGFVRGERVAGTTFSRSEVVGLVKFFLANV